MNILHTVESYYPSGGGMVKVVSEISKYLSSKGHQVTIATKYDEKRNQELINNCKIKSFKISGKLVEGIKGDKSEIERYRNFLKNSKFDIVANFAAQQWATDLALDILPEITAKKVFVPTGFSALYNPIYNDYFNKMIGWMQRYDMNIFLSEDYRDINFARKHSIKNIKVIPNGASKQEFLLESNIDIRSKLKIPDNHDLILLVGSHTGLKGHIPAIQIFKKSKIRNASLLIIGKSHNNKGCTKKCKFNNFFSNLDLSLILKNKKIKIDFGELTRKQTIAAFKQADLFLFPSQIECSPLVLFEAMASKTPFLATNVGNAKEIVQWSRSGIILPTYKKNGYSYLKIKESTSILKQIMNNHEKRKKMADSGFKTWKQNFTWKKIAKEYEKLYLSLINK